MDLHQFYCQNVGSLHQNRRILTKNRRRWLIHFLEQLFWGGSQIEAYSQAVSPPNGMKFCRKTEKKILYRIVDDASSKNPAVNESQGPKLSEFAAFIRDWQELHHTSTDALDVQNSIHRKFNQFCPVISRENDKIFEKVADFHSDRQSISVQRNARLWLAQERSRDRKSKMAAPRIGKFWSTFSRFCGYFHR